MLMLFAFSENKFDIDSVEKSIFKFLVVLIFVFSVDLCFPGSGIFVLTSTPSVSLPSKSHTSIFSCHP